MERVQLTAKGQVTIPAGIRRLLDLQGGAELLLEADPHTGDIRLTLEASLPDLYRTAPATRSYPGRREMRHEAGHKAASRRMLQLGRAA